MGGGTRFTPVKGRKFRAASLNLAERTLTANAPEQQNRHPYNNQGYLPNGSAPHQGPVPGATPLLPNQGRVIQTGPIRVLCIADVRGTKTLGGKQCVRVCEAKLTRRECR